MAIERGIVLGSVAISGRAIYYKVSTIDDHHEITSREAIEVADSNHATLYSSSGKVLHPKITATIYILRSQLLYEAGVHRVHTHTLNEVTLSIPTCVGRESKDMRSYDVRGWRWCAANAA